MTTTATLFTVPTREEVSARNQTIFDSLTKHLGSVPNLYATFAYSDSALSDYLNLQTRKSSLSAKEKELITLVVSQVNECEYCLAAHTILAQKQGFTLEQTIEIRHGRASFDGKLNALAQFVHSVAEQRGKVNESEKAMLLDAGYTRENMVDIVMVIGDKIITNYLHNVTEIPVDFPAAPAI